MRYLKLFENFNSRDLVQNVEDTDVVYHDDNSLDLKKYNESYFKQVEDLNKIIDPIRDDIRDILVDLVGYDIKFIPANMLDSSIGFELLIVRKGYYNDGSGPIPGNEGIDPVAIDEDILDEFGRLIHFIESEIGFYYTNSFYRYILIEKGIYHRGKDLFSSLLDQQEGKKFIISISMFFGNKIAWLKPKESTKTDTPVKESLDKFNYRQVDLDLREDIRDIFLDLVDDEYEVKFKWEPIFSEDGISSGNYPFVSIFKQGLNASYDGDGFRFSSSVLEEYMFRLGDMMGGEWDLYLEWMANDGKYYLGKSGKVYNSMIYRILMVRK